MNSSVFINWSLRINNWESFRKRIKEYKEKQRHLDTELDCVSIISSIRELKIFAESFKEAQKETAN